MTDIDAVARAVWRAHCNGETDAEDYPDLPDYYLRLYPRLAQAAIDALCLTEEQWSYQPTGTTMDDPVYPYRRHVGPWVRCETV